MGLYLSVNVLLLVALGYLARKAGAKQAALKVTDR